MPAADSRVLEWIRGKRHEVSSRDPADRIKHSILWYGRLRTEVMEANTRLERSDYDKILKTLHDLGDVFWSQ